MRTRSLVILLVAGVSYGQSLPPSRAVSSTEPAMTVRVYNYARLSRSELNPVELVATRVFAEGGIRILWYDCGPSKSADEDPNCRDNVRITNFTLRICRNCTSFIASPAPDVRGFATGQTATVSSAWSDELSQALYVPSDELLGRVIVHELGHLLLGPGHSRGGIMKAHWGPEDLHRSNLGMLNFTSEQAALIRSNLQRGRADETAVLEDTHVHINSQSRIGLIR